MPRSPRRFAPPVLGGGALAVAVVVLGLTTSAHAKHAPEEVHAAATASDRPAATWRIPTVYGAVRVWIPAGYEPASAHVVVYMHGYYVNTDRAWTEHRLPAQFAAAARNAVIIACDGPEDSAERVSWRSLPRLLEIVAKGIERSLPSGPIHAIAHGGGARTVAAWLESPRLRSVVLLDSPFVPSRPFTRWSDARSERRLVSVVTRHHVQPPGARADDHVLDGFAALAADVALGDTGGGRTYIRARLNHRELVTAGVAIPRLLRALAPALPDGALATDRPRRFLRELVNRAAVPASS